MQTEEFIFEQANRQILAKRPSVSQPLGKDICDWFSYITKSTKRNSCVVEMFSQIIGPELTAHCQAQSLKAGVLIIRVRPGPYMFHIRNMSSRILQQLQTAYPSANIREIKLVSGPMRNK